SVLLGVPHTEVFIDDITKAPVTTQGPILEKHDIFPANTNVNYIEVVNDKHIKVRTWERGAGATLACGTGSCA
ncbi:Diaminopimelate epimerase, partial [human gut metagenome]